MGIISRLTIDESQGDVKVLVLFEVVTNLKFHISYGQQSSSTIIRPFLPLRIIDGSLSRS